MPRKRSYQAAPLRTQNVVSCCFNVRSKKACGSGRALFNTTMGRMRFCSSAFCKTNFVWVFGPGFYVSSHEKGGGALDERESGFLRPDLQPRWARESQVLKPERGRGREPAVATFQKERGLRALNLRKHLPPARRHQPCPSPAPPRSLGPDTIWWRGHICRFHKLFVEIRNPRVYPYWSMST